MPDPQPLAMFENVYAGPQRAARRGARAVRGLPGRVRLGGGGPMTHADAVQGAQRGPAQGAGGRPQGAHHGRGRRQARRRVPGHRRAAEGLRREPGGGHPAGRVGHRRHRDRARAARLPAGLRDPVRRLRVPRVRPDRQPAGQDADALAGPAHDAGDDPDPVRRRHRRGRAPQRVAGGPVRAHRRAARGGLRQRHRRLHHDPAVDPLRRPGDLLRAEAPVLGQGRRGHHGRAERGRPAGPGPDGARRAPT